MDFEEKFSLWLAVFNEELDYKESQKNPLEYLLEERDDAQATPDVQ